MFRTKMLTAAAAVLVCSLSLPDPSLSQETNASQDARTTFELGTASVGGTYHDVGVALSSLIDLKLLPSSGVRLQPVNTGGSADNLDLLREGDLDFAILQGLFGYFSRTGTGPAEEAGPQTDLRAVTMLWQNVSQVIVRKSAVTEDTVSDFLNLADSGAKVSIGRPGSGGIVSNTYLLDNLGANVDGYNTLPEGYSDSAKAFIAGDIDGLIVNAGPPANAVASIFEQAPGEFEMLNVSDEQLQQADAGLNIFTRHVLPAGTYQGQTDDVLTIGQPNFLAVREDVDEEAVYQITKAIFENLPYLQNLHPATKALTLERSLEALPVAIHPGAARYYKEVGLTVPEIAALPDEYDLFQTSFSSSEEAKAVLNDGLVGLLASNDSAADRFIDELLPALEDTDGLRLFPQRGAGSSKNLADLLFTRGVDLAMVQADALEYARRQELLPGLVNKVNYISRLYDAELHLIVPNEITDVSQLENLKVNFGPSGGSSEVTGAILFDSLGISVEQTSFDHALALEYLKEKKISAMVYVAPKPSPLLIGLNESDGLRLLSVDPVEFANAYRPTFLSAEDYPELISDGGAISTFGVNTLLVAYGWQPEDRRHEPVAKFVDAFFSKLPEIQNAPGRHPKWREIDPQEDFPGWVRFPVAREWLLNNSTG